MTKTFHFDHDAGRSLYVRLWKLDGTVFDFDDNTFKTIGTATTPQAAMTERVDMNGTDRSGYTVAINLANVHNQGAALDLVLLVYDNAAPAAGDVAVSEPLSITVQFGELGEGELVAMVDGALTSSAGSEVRFLAWLERNGKRIALAAGTCTITVREQGAGVDLFDEADAAPNADGVFEIDVATPGFVDDRLYEVQVDIVENGNTHSTTHAVPVFG